MATRRDFLKIGTALGLGGLLPARADEAAPGYQLGCYTRPWEQFDYQVALDGIAEAGFPYAGIMTQKGRKDIITVATTPEEAARIGEGVHNRGLKTLSVSSNLPASPDIETGVKGLRLLIDHCVACGSPNLLLVGAEDPKLADAYYKAVAEGCDYAREMRVGLSIKPHGGDNSTGSQCRALIERVNYPNFRLTYDPGNIFYYSNGQLDPVDDAATVDGIVTAMCVKDYLDPKNVLVTPGTGRVNFQAVLTRLREGGFTRGPMIVECLDKKSDSAAIIAEAKKALHFLDELIAKVS